MNISANLIGTLSARALALLVAVMLPAGTFTDAAYARVHHSGVHKSAIVGHRHGKTTRKKSPAKPKPPSFLEGTLFVDRDGKAVSSSKFDQALFNPASNTKIATSWAILAKLGPEHIFQTQVLTNGTVKDGVLKGDLFVSGQDVRFGNSEAQQLAKILNEQGIKVVGGNLVVTAGFSMNKNTDPDAESDLATGMDAGNLLLKQIDPSFPKAAAPDAKGPHVQIRGQLVVNDPPTGATLIVTHFSPPLKDLLKIMLSLSDNDMAEHFGAMIGGPQALTDLVVKQLGVAPGEVKFASTSGLFVNRISPRAMMTVLKALRDEAAKSKLSLSDLMPVAGIDVGTLANRFKTGGFAGSVIGKTGTLPETNDGASALSGEAHAKGGVYTFVIFELHGSISTFRGRQDTLVQQFVNAHGGPKPINYKPIIPGIAAKAFWK
jgi:D-alanyl-D-alanine carboxypeptidase/D-alanyl-D-alanine-endopeptidase (penicillin-binding protein 4)